MQFLELLTFWSYILINKGNLLIGPIPLDSHFFERPKVNSIWVLDQSWVAEQGHFGVHGRQASDGNLSDSESTVAEPELQHVCSVPFTSEEAAPVHEQDGTCA